MRKQPVWMETPKTVNSEKGWVQREEREIKKEKRVGRHIVKGSGEGRREWSQRGDEEEREDKMGIHASEGKRVKEKELGESTVDGQLCRVSSVHLLSLIQVNFLGLILDQFVFARRNSCILTRTLRFTFSNTHMLLYTRLAVRPLTGQLCIEKTVLTVF